MITIKSNTPYLSIPFRDVLNVDSIQNLKEDIDPDEKAQLEQLINSKAVKDVIEQIKKDRLDAMAEAERAEREDGPFKYLAAFTKHPAK